MLETPIKLHLVEDRGDLGGLMTRTHRMCLQQARIIQTVECNLRILVHCLNPPV